MNAVLTTLLALIEKLLPLITSPANAALIGSIISTLTSIVPFVVKEVQTVAPAIKNIIAALSANPATTAAQLEQLKQLDAATDAAFEAAAAQTDAES